MGFTVLNPPKTLEEGAEQLQYRSGVHYTVNTHTHIYIYLYIYFSIYIEEPYGIVFVIIRVARQRPEALGRKVLQPDPPASANLGIMCGLEGANNPKLLTQ